MLHFLPGVQKAPRHCYFPPSSPSFLIVVKKGNQGKSVWRKALYPDMTEAWWVIDIMQNTECRQGCDACKCIRPLTPPHRGKLLSADLGCVWVNREGADDGPICNKPDWHTRIWLGTRQASVHTDGLNVQQDVSTELPRLPVWCDPCPTVP